MAERRDWERPADWDDDPPNPKGESYKPDPLDKVDVVRTDADDVPPGFARSFDGALYKLPTETEIESLAFSSGLEAKFYPTGEKARDQRRQQLERLGRMPTFGSAALEPGHGPTIDHADEDDTAERAAQAREQAELETFLHGIHK